MFLTLRCDYFLNINLDPAGLFQEETPENMFSATAKLLDETRDYPHFVLSSGCDIPLGTPLENVQAISLR